MAQNVLTDAGFNRPTLSELVQIIGDRLEGAVGPINREADSSTGQFIGSMAEAMAIAYETSEAVWLSRFIESASGMALDAIGEWMDGLQRRHRSQTQVNAVVYGAEGTRLPVGTIASYQNTNFTLVDAVTITRGSLVNGTVRVTNNTQASYTIRANGVDYKYTKAASDTVNNIAAGLASLINASPFLSATANGADIIITSLNLVQGYSVSINNGLSWQQIGTAAVFKAVDYGAIAVPVGTLNNPVSAVSGWTGVTNLVIGSTGNERETDYDYRQRLKNSVGSTTGKSTAESIRAALLNNVEGVTLAQVLENDTMEVDENGLYPKSILCIVDGGLEQEVGQVIWEYKGAGIETNGDITITVEDSSGKPRLVRFSRSDTTGVYVKVNVQALESEETIPADIVTLIEDGVRNYFATLGLGDDVITQRILGYVYDNTTGIAKMQITTSTDGTTFNENNISIPETGSASVVSIAVTGV